MAVTLSAGAVLLVVIGPSGFGTTMIAVAPGLPVPQLPLLSLPAFQYGAAMIEAMG
jgi:hypothetical protein